MDFFNSLPEIPTFVIQIGRAVILLLLAWIVSRVTRRALYGLNFSRTIGNRAVPIRQERVDTIRRMLASFITFLAFTFAILSIMSPLIGQENLVWLASLFGAAFGFGVMPLVKDFFTGFTFLFEDTFDVGDKVELLVPMSVIGVVENVNLRTTLLRAETGEIYTIPNGEIRVSRNFSRGLHSQADVRITISADDIDSTLELLDAWASSAMLRLPNLIEPWRVINETGSIGDTVELKIIAKARYGMAAELRPRLLAFVHERLERRGVDLIDKK